MPTQKVEISPRWSVEISTSSNRETLDIRVYCNDGSEIKVTPSRSCINTNFVSFQFSSKTIQMMEEIHADIYRLKRDIDEAMQVVAADPEHPVTNIVQAKIRVLEADLACLKEML